MQTVAIIGTNSWKHLPGFGGSKGGNSICVINNDAEVTAAANQIDKCLRFPMRGNGIF
jgi:hypothetical protein